MPNKTSNYQLNQWQGSDPVLRTDFNEDNAKLEAALTAGLATKAEIVVGTYTGDGAQNRVIDLGFQPKAVLVMDKTGRAGDSTGQLWIHGGLAFPGEPVIYGERNVLNIVSNGFEVHTENDGHVNTNASNCNYHYIAFK